MDATIRSDKAWFPERFVGVLNADAGNAMMIGRIRTRSIFI